MRSGCTLASIRASWSSVPSVTHGSLQGGHPEWSSHSYSHMTQPHDLDNHLALDAWVAKDAQ